MAVTAKWTTPEAIVSTLTTTLNALANGSGTSSATIDNETDLFQYINLELVLASLTPTGTPSVDVYIAPALDATPNIADLVVSEAELLATFPLSTSAGAKRVIRANLVIPPLKFQVLLVNNSGVSLAASGNTLKYRRHNEQGV